MNLQGTLIPIGGNENKGIKKGEKYHTENIEDGILYRVVMESGGKDSKIVVVPTASSIPDEVSANYKSAFSKLGCENISFADIRTREDSENPENLKLVSEADCVWFSGGNQSEIIRKIKDTKFHQIIEARNNENKLVIAGTSAGAMCMSQRMIKGGSSKESFIKGAVKMGSGMGFIQGVIIDSHFIQRGRFGRTAEACARYPELLGIGLAENTGLVIKNAHTFEVIGSGMVILFDATELRNNNHTILKAGEPISLTNLKTHILARRDMFRMDSENKFQFQHMQTPVMYR
ncbi:cyanophycinase [Gramella sp. AN32]|uniref:Cyanophycinase n=1 Tax=Christiangramia antarctica TaxID=2058158 RepID=A0ABW5X194_9FLAO|nr:cyanophycinase [Gramella sp. AN32]MCM4155675.1 cyanophycinase [Gramella sp. AN32]